VTCGPNRTCYMGCDCREAALAERIERLEDALEYQARCPGCGDTDCDLGCVELMPESDKTSAIQDGCAEARAALDADGKGEGG